MTKLNKTYKHPGPITSLASDNIKIYLADLRNRITVYPDEISYDFVEPKVFYKKYIYTLSENRLYAHTGESTNLLFEFPKETTDIKFGPAGGTIYSCLNGLVSIYDTLGNLLGGFMASDYTVIENNNKCFIIEEKNDKLNSIETYVRNLEAPDIEFPKVEIKKRIITTDDYEEKYCYVDNGNKKSMKKENTVSKRYEKADYEVESSSANEYVKGEDKKFVVSDSEVDNSFEIEEQANREKSTIFNPIYQVKNPSTYENMEGKLLFYSSQGFMISLESANSNQIFVKFHDRSFGSYEVKDLLKCRLGSFLGKSFVISDGKRVNFSDIWTKEISCSLLGLNSKNIYVFDQNDLTVFNYAGDIVDNYFVKDAYSFCCSENSLAVFCKDTLMLIEENKADYIPCSAIEFGCFDKNSLFVKIGKKIFVLYNKILKAVCDIDKRPLTVYDGNVVVLEENVLLPRPEVKFYQIKDWENTVSK